MSYSDLFEDGGFSRADSIDSSEALKQTHPEQHKNQSFPSTCFSFEKKYASLCLYESP